MACLDELTAVSVRILDQAEGNADKDIIRGHVLNVHADEGIRREGRWGE